MNYFVPRLAVTIGVLAFMLAMSITIIALVQIAQQPRPLRGPIETVPQIEITSEPAPEPEPVETPAPSVVVPDDVDCVIRWAIEALREEQAANRAAMDRFFMGESGECQ